MDDRQPSTENANAALLAWCRHLVAARMVHDEIVEQTSGPLPAQYSLGSED
jgi:hypothetical protein